MMKGLRQYVIGMMLCTTLGHAATGPFGARLCQEKNFSCLTVTKGQTWNRLWPDPAQRDLIRRLNRMNIALQVGMRLAVPDDWATATLETLAPFPLHADTGGEKKILIDLPQLAWGAYDTDGRLLRWGPVSGGKGWCPDIAGPCVTPGGTFNIQRKGGAGCKSGTFPIPDGGAPMPYCMFFRGGYALHGANVPGYHASHGCVRLFTEDAKWLNTTFVDLPTAPGAPGTTVVILPAAPRRTP